MKLTSEIEGNKDIEINDVIDIFTADSKNNYYVAFKTRKSTWLDYWKYTSTDEQVKEFESIQKQLK